MQLIIELHKLCGSNTCIELLRLTEKAHHQIFSSKICIFSVLRKISRNGLQIHNELNNAQNNLISSLSSLHFNIQEIDTKQSEFKGLLKTIDDSCVFSVKLNVCRKRGMFIIKEENFHRIRKALPLLGQSLCFGITQCEFKS